MKLIYVYFDFTKNGKAPEGYRGHKKCELNFGTDYYYTLQDSRVPFYALQRIKRLPGEEIVRGFWGDERLYNISALVGDNGAGKSTLIHEIIDNLLKIYERAPAPSYPSILLMQDSRENLYLFHTISAANADDFRLEDEAHLPLPLEILHTAPDETELDGKAQQDCEKALEAIKRTKLIYFSNALTMEDARQYYAGSSTVRTDVTDIHALYRYPLYDCSLVADMAEALKSSNVGANSLEEVLNTYFNFKSYQEARYLFDRNQRRLLLKMRNQEGCPVPAPNELKIFIKTSTVRLRTLTWKEEDSPEDLGPRQSLLKDFEVWVRAYNSYIDKNRDSAFALLAELSLNCIANFLMPVVEYLTKNFIVDLPLPSHFGQKESYTACLDSLWGKICENHKETAQELDDFYVTCRNYIVFLWNNEAPINTYFNIHVDFEYAGNKLLPVRNIRCTIPLGSEIDAVLEEFMIRFVNLTRAVSLWHYFVIYNWGLSSGETNLLHMFTKLRYLLQGNIYDKNESTAPITAESAKAAPPAKRKEYLCNAIHRDGGKQPYTCDSVILFIDEADLTFHPEWQRQFVAVLSTFVPRLFQNPYDETDDREEPEGCREIQIIMTTHSPLMLGDFPAASVIYLKREDEKKEKHEGSNASITVNDRSQLQTFGQNLYTILKDGFYLTNGTIGELAHRKIKQVLACTNAIREDVSELEKASDKEKIANLLKELDDHTAKTVQYLPKGIIRSKLEEEICICRRILCQLPSNTPAQPERDTYTEKRIQDLEAENLKLKKEMEALKRRINTENETEASE